MAKVKKDREPLPDIKCGDVKCKDGLHDYRHKIKPRDKEHEGTPCHACGDETISWSEFNERDLSNVDLTFEALQNEFIRHGFWNVTIDDILRQELLAKGKNKIEKDVTLRIEKSLQLAGKDLFRDGTQTPLNKYNIIFFAQHATATCCRKCLRRWHLIPYDQKLSDQNMKYVKNIIMAYILKRVPELNDFS